LAAGGFDKPRLFVDGVKDASRYDHLGLEVTTRYPTIRTYGNWLLALWELYIRNPAAERYAIFQDDIITYRNLRQYLEQTTYGQGPGNGFRNLYYNLYTYPVNQNPPPSEEYTGWHASNQMGRGALALVFSRPAISTLLEQPHIIAHPQNAQRGWRGVDGAVVTAMGAGQWLEYIHAPTLVQHTGTDLSSMKNRGYRELPITFKGESYDALQLLPATKPEKV
jgi:hypothetical protein